MTWLDKDTLSSIGYVDQALAWVVIQLERSNRDPLNLFQNTIIKPSSVVDYVNWQIIQDENGNGQFYFNALLPYYNLNPFTSVDSLINKVGDLTGHYNNDFSDIDAPTEGMGIALPAIPEGVVSLETALIWLVMIVYNQHYVMQVMQYLKEHWNYFAIGTRYEDDGFVYLDYTSEQIGTIIYASQARKDNPIGYLSEQFQYSIEPLPKIIKHFNFLPIVQYSVTSSNISGGGGGDGNGSDNGGGGGSSTAASSLFSSDSDGSAFPQSFNDFNDSGSGGNNDNESSQKLNIPDDGGIYQPTINECKETDPSMSIYNMEIMNTVIRAADRAKGK